MYSSLITEFAGKAAAAINDYNTIAEGYKLPSRFSPHTVERLSEAIQAKQIAAELQHVLNDVLSYEQHQHIANSREDALAAYAQHFIANYNADKNDDWPEHIAHQQVQRHNLAVSKALAKFFTPYKNAE